MGQHFYLIMDEVRLCAEITFFFDSAKMFFIFKYPLIFKYSQAFSGVIQGKHIKNIKPRISRIFTNI